MTMPTPSSPFVPSLLPTLAARIEAAAGATGGRAGRITFVAGEDETRVSWAELHDDARAMAAALQSRGVAPGDHVAVLGPTTRRLVTAMQATWLAGATLVVLPLLPDKPLDPYCVFNLRLVWIVVILVMGVSAAGYIAIRLLGVRFGLPLSGFAAGFVSSSATIGAMAARVKQAPDLLRPAAAGAVLSTVATVVELALLLAATSMAALAALAAPLACAGVMAVLYGGLFTLWALKHEGSGDEKPGRAFNLATALALAATLTVILVASAALQAWLGEAGIVMAAGVAGFADAHSAAVSAASLVAAQKMTAVQAVYPVLAALTTNTVTKVVLAFTGGSRAFAFSVVPGLLLVAAAAWAGAFLMPAPR